MGMTRIYFAVLLLAANPVLAAELIRYTAQVNGMVCAFCAYNVTKRIRSLPGVEPRSVDVNLSNGQVVFTSRSRLDQNDVARVFMESGFELVSIDAADTAADGKTSSIYSTVLNLSFSSATLDQYTDLLESIGALAEKNGGKITLASPEDLEIPILKPILGGRQQAIKVDYTPVLNNEVELSLLLERK